MGVRDPATTMVLDIQELTRLLTGDADAPAALRRVVQLTIELVPGCDYCSVSEFPTNRTPRTQAASSSIALRVDALQYEFAEGPCQDAATLGRVVEVDDLTQDQRWQRFVQRAVEDSPVRSVLSLCLAPKPSSSLNLYGAVPMAFTAESISTGALLSVNARKVLSRMVRSGVAEPTEALNTSRMISAAVGILMSANRWSSEQALTVLWRTSRSLNVKIRELPGHALR
jgi:hypothetical protein